MHGTKGKVHGDRDGASDEASYYAKDVEALAVSGDLLPNRLGVVDEALAVVFGRLAHASGGVACVGNGSVRDLGCEEGGHGLEE